MVSEHIRGLSIRERRAGDGLGSEDQICCLLSPSAPGSSGMGALGAVLCLPPHEEALRGFVCVTVWSAEQSSFTGELTEVGWVQVSMSWVCGERFPEVAAGG